MKHQFEYWTIREFCRKRSIEKAKRDRQREIVYIILLVIVAMIAPSIGLFKLARHRNTPAYHLQEFLDSLPDMRPQHTPGRII